jgi:hypothetical protein
MLSERQMEKSRTKHEMDASGNMAARLQIGFSPLRSMPNAGGSASEALPADDVWSGHNEILTSFAAPRIVHLITAR